MMPPTSASEAAPLVLNGEDETRALAARLAPLLRPGDVVALAGPLGAGKSVFARGVIHAVAARAGEPLEDVPSPTFTLVQIYPAGELTLYHFDLFRLDDPEQAWELGIEDAFAEGVSLIEWPERLAGLLPADRLDIELAPGAGPDQRIATLRGRGTWPVRLAGTRLGPKPS